MSKYRKKPVVIEAFQWVAGLPIEETPGWFYQAWRDGRVNHYEIDVTKIFIETLEGTHRADSGDYIIRGVKGELYPCKSDIFKMTYEPVCEDEESDSRDTGLTVTVDVDTSEVDRAKESVQELITLLERADKLKEKIEPACNIKPIINIHADTSKRLLQEMCDEIIKLDIERYGKMYGKV